MSIHMDRRTALMSASLALLAACGGGGGGAEAAPPSPPSPPPVPPGWAVLADMPVALAKFGAAAVGSRIVACGGYDTRRTVLIFDLATGAWSTGPLLLAGSDNLSVLEAGGRIHAIGGEARTAHQVFDPVAGSWSAGPASPAIRFASAAAVQGGKLHLIGGWNYNNAATGSYASHDIYDPVAGTWAAAAPLATARNAAAAVAVGGKVYVVGGRAPGIRAGDQTSLASVEVYDPATNSWSAGPDLPQARASLALVVLRGLIYAFGGESTPGGVRNHITRLDPATGVWTTLVPMPFSAHGLSAVVVGDAIYLMGGFAGASDAVGTELRALWRYTPEGV